MAQTELPAEPSMIAISSGKGGVGKSTVTANIAVAMAEAGLRVGVVDADIYGPSIPRMLGIPAGKPAMSPAQKVIPAEAYGVNGVDNGAILEFNYASDDSALRGRIRMKTSPDRNTSRAARRCKP